MSQTLFKCFKHVANIQNTFIIFKMHCKCFKRVVNVSNTLLIFKTRLKCLKCVLTVSTGDHGLRKVIWDTMVSVSAVV